MVRYPQPHHAVSERLRYMKEKSLMKVYDTSPYAQLARIVVA